MSYFIAAVLLFFSSTLSFAQGKDDAAITVVQNQENPANNSKEINEDVIEEAWKISHENNLEEINALVESYFTQFESEIKSQAESLKQFPIPQERSKYKNMNDYATLLFIQAEMYMKAGQNDKAIALFSLIVKEYPFSQAWDPSRGSFWSINEKAIASMCVIDKTHCKEEEVKEQIKTVPTIATQGKEMIIDYRKYGNFNNPGTNDYRYQITDLPGLSAAAGEGIYPNLSDIFKNPNYKKALKEGRLTGSHWDYVNTIDLEAAYFKWATAEESPGVKLFYIANIFEKAKMFPEAIKAYHSLIVHFPKTVAWTYWHTPWYPAQAAVSKIKHIIRSHPELKFEFKWGKITIENAFDNDINNDVIVTKPGIIRELNALDLARESLHLDKPKMPLGKIERFTSDTAPVRLVKYESGHWQLLVNNKPFLIKGITYAPTKVGQGPDNHTLTNWMQEDTAFKAFVDKNLNNEQDDDEAAEGDFAIMKDMGVNTLRIYDHPDRPLQKEMLRKMHEQYGFMVLMGNLIGKYAVGSGASWNEGTDYENPDHIKHMLDDVKRMVMEFKDEPYVLMWLLGNENNYGVASNADKKPDAFYKFVNEVALMIKSIDPNHPVAICNGDVLFLDKLNKYAPDIDAIGANLYRGDYGFGSFWQQIAEQFDKPAFVTEYGAPAFGGQHMTYEEAQEEQAAYHRGNWLDILYNSAGYEEGYGNSIGGVAFAWVDEWWKNYEPAKHDTKADAVGPFVGGYYFEEWFGLFGQGDGKHSPYLREPRKVYYTYRELWR